MPPRITLGSVTRERADWTASVQILQSPAPSIPSRAVGELYKGGLFVRNFDVRVSVTGVFTVNYGSRGKKLSFHTSTNRSA